MKGSSRKFSTLAGAVALALGSSAVLAQQPAEEVQDAERRLERAEAREERAEEVVEERRHELEEAKEVSEAREEHEAREARDAERDSDDKDWDELRAENATLSSFLDALQATGLADTITGSTAYTVFAPTNDAFEDEWNDLREADDQQELIELLRAHIVADDLDAERVRSLDQALTVDGGAVDISYEDGELTVGGATVVESDIHRGNLRIHAIDDVLDVNPAKATTDLREDDGEDDRDGLFGGIFNRDDPDRDDARREPE